jgi:hypothetical protein
MVVVVVGRLRRLEEQRGAGELGPVQQHQVAALLLLDENDPELLVFVGQF